MANPHSSTMNIKLLTVLPTNNVLFALARRIQLNVRAFCCLFGIDRLHILRFAIRLAPYIVDKKFLDCIAFYV